MDDAAIVVFARHPTPGRVKTRLAAGVGPESAAQFYKHCAETVIAECLKTTAAVTVLFSAVEEEAAVKAWLAPLPDSSRIHFAPQVQSPDLGDRLAAGMATAFAAGHRRVAVVGTDVPDLSAAHLESAFQALSGENDAVFGPAADGGYYLFAVKGAAVPHGLFSGIEWSTAAVLKQNSAAAERVGLHLAPLDTLPTLRDIDTVEDLRAWATAAETEGKYNDSETLRVANEILKRL